MTYLIDYDLSPVRKQGLNETLDVTVTVKHPNNLPVVGKSVSLKLVKNTVSKIKHIKSNIEPDGFLNNVINPNIHEGCIWQSIYNFEKIADYKEEIKDFTLSRTGKPIALFSDHAITDKSIPIRGIKGKKVLITPNGDYVIDSKDEINLILPSLSNHIKKYHFFNDITDFCVDENNKIYVLERKYEYKVISAGDIQRYSLPSDFNYVHFYRGKGYFIDDKDCTVISGENILDGFNLSAEKIVSFQGFQENLIYITESYDKVHVYNTITKHKKEISIGFLAVKPNSIKVDPDLNIYIALEHCIYKIQKQETKPFIEILIDNEPSIESFSLTTSGSDKITVAVKNSKKEWLAWEQQTTGELRTYAVPIGEKVSFIRIFWEGLSPRTISSISDFMIQGSANFGQIVEPEGLTNSKGQVKFTYIARQISKPEKFIAVVK